MCAAVCECVFSHVCMRFYVISIFKREFVNEEQNGCSLLLTVSHFLWDLIFRQIWKILKFVYPKIYSNEQRLARALINFNVFAYLNPSTLVSQTLIG